MEEKLIYENDENGLIVTTHRISRNGKDIFCPSGSCIAWWESAGLFSGYNVEMLGATDADFDVSKQIYTSAFFGDLLKSSKKWGNTGRIGKQLFDDKLASEPSVSRVIIGQKMSGAEAQDLVAECINACTKALDAWRELAAAENAENEAHLKNLERL